MSFYNDYLLRQIEDMAKLLGKTFFHYEEDVIPLYDAQGNVTPEGFLLRRLEHLLQEKAYGKAEDLLFETLPLCPTALLVQVGLQFYHTMAELPPQDLQAGGFSVQELEEGLQDFLAECRKLHMETEEQP